jgi:hypothetical protein
VVVPPCGAALWMITASLATGSPWSAGNGVIDDGLSWLGSSSVPATPPVVSTASRAFPAWSYVAWLESSRKIWPSPDDPPDEPDGPAGVNVELAPTGTGSRIRWPETAAGWPGRICCPPTTTTDCPCTGTACGSGAPVSCSLCR